MFSAAEVNIETINTCTRKCPYCKFGLDRKWEKKFMPVDVFEKILCDLKSVAYSGLIGPFVNNEPLMDSRMVLFVGMISSLLPSAQSYLYSNGDLAELGLLRSLFDAGLRKMIISVHSPERISDFEEFLRRFGSDRISLFHVYDFDRKNSFHNRGGSIGTDTVNQRRFQGQGCVLPFRQAVINPEGTVYLCCCDFYYDVTFGNVKSSSLADIFSNDGRLNEIRDHLMQKGRKGLSLCQECSVPPGAPLMEL